MVFAYEMHREQIGAWDDTMKQMQIGNRTFDWEQGKVYVMGILNVTPDSFSDGGRYDSVDASLYHVEEMIAQGVDLVDLGGGDLPSCDPFGGDQGTLRHSGFGRYLQGSGDGCCPAGRGRHGQ